MAEYTPSEKAVRGNYVHWILERENPVYAEKGAEPLTADEASDEFDRFLARVKRDAARSALDGLAMRFERMGDYADLADQPGRPFWEAQEEAEEYRDEFYPRRPRDRPPHRP